MVPISRRTLVIAALTAQLGCGPRATPAGPGTKPSTGPASPKTAGPPPARPPARPVMIGEMCPEGAAGRPGVMPAFALRLAWTAGDDVGAMVSEGEARRFTVLDWAGARAGVFSVAGSGEIGDRQVAIGAYAGRSPCVTGDAKTTGGQPPPPDPVCVEAQDQCGVAIAPIEAAGGFGSRPYGEEPDTLDLRTSGACVVGDKLLVDIDGDGVVETFPAADFLGPVRAPADEVAVVPGDGATCTPTFSVHNALPAGNPKHWRGLDVLAVFDVDGDGRYELLLSYHYSDRRTWAVYSARGSAARLELMGEAMPWPRP